MELTMGIRWIHQHLNWLFFCFIDKVQSCNFNGIIHFLTFVLTSHSDLSFWEIISCINICKESPEALKTTDPSMSESEDIRWIKVFEHWFAIHAFSSVTISSWKRYLDFLLANTNFPHFHHAFLLFNSVQMYLKNCTKYQVYQKWFSMRSQQVQLIK